VKDCYIRKVKVLKKPKLDVTELMEWHSADEKTADVGKPVEPVVEESLAPGSGGRL
jgi:small subunit ribosomal protein S3Ae